MPMSHTLRARFGAALVVGGIAAGGGGLALPAAATLKFTMADDMQKLTCGLTQGAYGDRDPFAGGPDPRAQAASYGCGKISDAANTAFNVAAATLPTGVVLCMLGNAMALAGFELRRRRPVVLRCIKGGL